jgi:hypothetical protein
VVDVTAYETLDALLQDLRNAVGVRVRDLDGLDFALQRIYRGPGFKSPARKATGALLARDLVHDGHRAHDRRAKREWLGVDDRDADRNPTVEALAVWESEVNTAVLVVERAATRLQARERLALALQARGLLTDETTLMHLGVRRRQAHNLANAARAVLLGDPEVAGAFETLLDALGAGHTSAIKAMLDDVFAGLADIPVRSS